MFYYGFTIYRMEEYLSSMGRGATNQTELSRQTVADLPFLQPSSFIVEQFESFAEDVTRQIQNLTRHNLSLQSESDLLLPRLMGGEIAV